ncbi:D-arabinono-1,4-lactone oxidase [Streptomyces sp. MA5143a]|uniref:D-arabinono-1,4-lactone oxidase n=1 Tax=Streptomyces sp. MA5143a TaxID=2083010 RepID=UPI000D1AF75E|nr:D-arabinono-1,4-lactone oxidase [Streptomyces sp. MA5143a]SPF05714.1 putative xylitol oxidase [Streptomyces sp. MA5143a]
MTLDTATNWAGNLTFGAARWHRPRSVDELRRTVADSARIRAVGSGHSFSAVADTRGDLVRLDALPPTVDLDPDASTVTVSAGLRYADVISVLERAGLALANLASLPHISVAGSVATGTHGSGDTQRCLAASVRALQLVGPEGDLVELSRDADPDLFPGAVVALGALGIVTRLTLDIEPSYAMAQRVRVAVPLDEVAAHFDAVSGAAHSVSVFTDWGGEEAQVWLKRRLDRPDSGWSGGRPADRPMNPVPGMPPEFSTEQLDVPGPWCERLPHFRPELTPGAGEELQSEYYLPRAAAPAAIAALRALGQRLAPALHIAEVRTVRADDLWLSPAHGRDSVTFHFTWVKDLARVQPLIADVEDALMPLGARPHWGKLTALAPREIAALYEQIGVFAQLARKYDPSGTFRNDFTDALLDTV